MVSGTSNQYEKSHSCPDGHHCVAHRSLQRGTRGNNDDHLHIVHDPDDTGCHDHNDPAGDVDHGRHYDNDHHLTGDDDDNPRR